MKYRPEIDGLRALAVIPVVLFHAGFKVFGGGYVGVDVFFVISGYLITSIILNELESGTFSLIHFYERRARRILPALFLVIFVCLPFAWMWLPPTDKIAFSESLVAVPFFASNILFYKTSGYFDIATELKPLIHTWSLAVEEQYYVLFPAFLLLTWKLGKRWIVGLLAVGFVTSLSSALWLSMKDSSFVFYMLPTRGWEVLIGAFIAFYFDNRNIRKQNYIVHQLASLIGIIFIAYAVITYSDQTPYPSIYTLAPTLGAALVIVFATHKTLVGKLLGSRLFVGIRLISYSAYLWHQPMFAFARERSLDNPSLLLMATLAMMSFVLAYISWRYIERPFRNKFCFSRERIFVYGALCSALFIGIGLIGLKYQILSLWKMQNCSSEIKKYGPADCKTRGEGDKKIVVWGDSHAAVLSKTIPDINGAKIYVISHFGCPPVVGVKRFDGLGNSVNCNNTDTLEKYAEYIKSLKPETVILVGRWSLYLNGLHKNGVLQKEHHFLSIENDDNDLKPIASRQAMLEKQLLKTINYFSKNSNVILLSQPPDYALYSLKKIQKSNFSAPLGGLMEWHKGELNMLYKFNTLSPKIKVLDSKRLFCDDKQCNTRIQGTLFYTDDNHLTYHASKMQWEIISGEILQERHPAITP